ncbi:hypothetical protein KVV02_002070 [Mortierella alpina]|uniref:glucan 1,3-beta-glucosidase n=1 Tax=Mortierella alpina TaxID=64518 RepID=A0A9P8CU48_MORAP|nr:hypothetical protein KVV02_002070 [Mortierella alpina]
MEARQDTCSCLRRYQWKISLMALVIIAAAVAVSLVVVKPWNNKNNHSTNDTAKVNAYTTALNEPFDYQNGTVKIRGVNLGGWLVLESFITPSLFNPYIAKGVVDEWTLCQHLGLPAATALLDNHYNTWVTEDTFIRIRDLGLNHVRILIRFWATGNLVAGEPYVPNLTLPYPQQMSTFFASPDHAHVNPFVGLLNEPIANLIGGDKVKARYTQAFAVVRAAGGGADTQNYVMFDDSLKRMNRTAQLAFACQTWGSDLTTSTKAFGLTMVGDHKSMPLWSYFDGVDNGWIPKDANNRGPSFCAANGYPVNVIKSL